MRSKFLLLFLSTLFSLYSFAQDAWQWHSGTSFQVNGKITTNQIEYYSRLPSHLESEVRTEVWNLSQHTAGLYLSFTTDADEIWIKYQVPGYKSLPHMPATGVSGVDLYQIDQKNDYKWVKGQYHFGDTISFKFSNLSATKNKQYRLYLPLYAAINWMTIGVPKQFKLTDNTINTNEKPIVVYGTSISQGACASRPGMAWTAILERLTSKNVVNLGFSGNGRLEPEIIQLMGKHQAAVYILDCLANFTPHQQLNHLDAKNRIIKSVLSLKKAQPDTPIILTAHAGYSDGVVQRKRFKIYNELNLALEQALEQLKKLGITQVYTISKQELGLNGNSFVDGTHPNDIGMMQYALAYQQLLNTILKL